MQINMLALDEGGNVIHHPVLVEALCHPIVPGHHFVFVPFGKECLLLELTRGVTIGRGINRWAALITAELHIFGMTPEDFSKKLAPYEIINGEYSTTETTCKGCSGPCGRCEKTA